MMSLTRLKAGAVVLLASCTVASLTILATGPVQDPAADAAARAEKLPVAGDDGVVPNKGRILTPEGNLVYVNVYSTKEGDNQNFLNNYALLSILPEIRRIRGVGTAAILGGGQSSMRIRLNPERMRANDLLPEDITRVFVGCSLIPPQGHLGKAMGKMSPSDEYVLTFTGRYNKPGQYENIILKASPDGELLRFKDIGQVEVATQSFESCLDKDGHPAVAIVLKQAPGSDAAGFIEAVEDKLKYIEKEWSPPGMEFEVIPLENRDMIYAVIETVQDSTLEYMSAKCHELAAIARGIDGITSVSSMPGYQIRTENRDSNAATCLIHLKARPGRKLTSLQIIKTLQEKCRTMNVDLGFFEPPAVSVFVAAGGFSVRVLDRTNANSDDRRPGTSMDDLLNRKDLASLFHALATNYPQHEMVINNDVALRKGVSIANAMENLPIVVGGDVQAERTFRRLAEEISNLSVKNDRGEMVPYSSFLQFKKKPGLNEIDR